MSAKVLDTPPRTAKAAIPFGVSGDECLKLLEGGCRRLKDGRVSFQDSPFNLETVRSRFPNLKIDLPIPIAPAAKAIKLGEYFSRAAPPQMSHQARGIEVSNGMPFFFFAMEQGTGKTRLAIDKLGHHYANGEVTGVLVVTFKGVHKQWVLQQIPGHIGNIKYSPKNTGKFHDSYENVPLKQIPFSAVAWTGLAPVWPEKQTIPILEFFTINFDAIHRPEGQKAVYEFVRRHLGKLAIVVDESQAIKTYDSKRTEACFELAKFARVRLCLTGTPIPNDIEDHWSQTLFLSESIVGVRYVSSFRKRFKDLEGKPINIDKFRALIAPYTFRVTKEEALDIPPKMYETYEFELCDKARKAYRELKRNFLTRVDDDKVTVQNAAVLMTRLQQICSGVLVGEDGQRFPMGSDRIEALIANMNRFSEEKKIIVWSRYVADAPLIQDACAKFGETVVLNGSVSDHERPAIIDRFMNSNDKVTLIANAAVGGTGYNFQGECKTNIYYTNSFNAVERWQSEDRTHRIGTTSKVLYVDLVARGTIDEYILKVLRAKKSFADLVLMAEEILNDDRY